MEVQICKVAVLFVMNSCVQPFHYFVQNYIFHCVQTLVSSRALYYQKCAVFHNSYSIFQLNVRGSF